MADSYEGRQPEPTQHEAASKSAEADLSEEQLDQVAGGTIVAVNGGGNTPNGSAAWDTRNSDLAFWGDHA